MSQVSNWDIIILALVVTLVASNQMIPRHRGQEHTHSIQEVDHFVFHVTPKLRQEKPCGVHPPGQT